MNRGLCVVFVFVLVVGLSCAANYFYHKPLEPILDVVGRPYTSPIGSPEAIAQGDEASILYKEKMNGNKKTG